MKRKARLFLFIFFLGITLLCFLCFRSHRIDGFTFSLPEEITEGDCKNQTISFFSNGTLIGGLIQFETPDPMCLIDPTPFATEILSILKAKGVTAANNPEFDRIMTSGLAAPDPYSAQISLGNGKTEYMHYLFFTETQGYDLWFDLSQVSEDIQQQILESCIVEN